MKSILSYPNLTGLTVGRVGGWDGSRVYFRINEVSTIRNTGDTYVHVDFWRRKAHFDAGDLPFLTNTWYMHLRPLQGVRRRKDGFLEKTDGTYIHPAAAASVHHTEFRYETGWDIRAKILNAIVKYWRWARTEGYSGDHTEDTTKPLKKKGALVKQGEKRNVIRNNSDPNRVLERPDVVGLRNFEREERDL